MKSTLPCRLLLVGWSGADWRRITPLLARGEMPHLARLIERGTLADIPVLQPVDVAPLVWTSIATGTRPERHGVLGDREVCAETGEVRPVGSASRCVPALWDHVSTAGGRAHVVHWPATDAAETTNGLFVSPNGAATAPGWIEEPLQAEGIALETLRLGPNEIEPSVLRRFLTSAPDAASARENLARLAGLLAESFTTHNYATLALDLGDADLIAVHYGGLAKIGRAFADPMDAAFAETVNSAYRLHDLFLGRLLDLAGDTANVLLVSDGAGTVRGRGLIVLQGPNVRRDERRHGATLLDIAPTALALLGYPAPGDLPGQPLTDAFTTPPAVRYADPLGPSALLHLPLRFGLEEPSAAAVEQERALNLAYSHMSALRYDLAVPLLEALYRQSPGDDLAIVLAESLCRVAMPRRARALLLPLVERDDSPYAPYLLGIALLEQGHKEEGLAHLRAVEAAGNLTAALNGRIGYAYVQSHQITEAQAAFTRAVQADPEDWIAWLGLAGCALLRRRMKDAIAAAQRSLALHHEMALTHAVLGRALQALRRPDEAIPAYENAIRFNPDFDIVHRVLSRMYADRPDGADAAAQHRRLAREAAVRRARARRENAERLAAMHQALESDR